MGLWNWWTHLWARTVVQPSSTRTESPMLGILPDPALCISSSDCSFVSFIINRCYWVKCLPEFCEVYQQIVELQRGGYGNSWLVAKSDRSVGTQYLQPAFAMREGCGTEPLNLWSLVLTLVSVRLNWMVGSQLVLEGWCGKAHVFGVRSVMSKNSSYHHRGLFWK